MAPAQGGPVYGQGTWENTLQARDLDGNGATDAFYDTSLNITWLRNASPAGNTTWSAAKSYANNLNFGGYSDWRLPTLSPVNGSNFTYTPVTNNGSTDGGTAKTGIGWGTASELGHLYYVSLANKGICTPNDASPGYNGCVQQPGYGPVNTGNFQNYPSFSSWTGLEVAGNEGSVAWAFGISNGYQGGQTENTPLPAMMVRNGDVAPPTCTPPQVLQNGGCVTLVPVPNDPSTKTGRVKLETVSGDFQTSKPTIVLSHGWQPTGSWNDGNGPFPMPELKAAVKGRLCDAQGNGCAANILTFGWKDAYHLLPWQPAWASWSAGARLASELARQIPGDYTQNIHLVGHSYGSALSAGAASMLTSSGAFQEAGYVIDQLTILDAPTAVAGQSYGVGALSKGMFYDLLPRGTVHYVDNYFGTAPVAFGEPIAGAAPNGGEQASGFIDHSGVQSVFYTNRVKSDSWVTAVLAETFDNRPAPTEWLGGESSLTAVKRISLELAAGVIDLAVDALETAANVWHSIVNAAQQVKEYVFEVAGKIYRVIADATNTIIKKTKDVVSTTVTAIGDAATAVIDTGSSVISATSNKLLTWLRLKESSPVMVGRAVTVPVGANTLSFDFDFLDVGDGDWITVFFKDRLLWSFTGEDFFGDSMHAVIDISEFAGQEGALYLTLNSTGARNADVLIGNMQFSSFDSANATVPEPSTVTLVLAALAMLMWNARARHLRNKAMMLPERYV